MAKELYLGVSNAYSIAVLVDEVLNLKRMNEELTKRLERLEQAVYSEEELEDVQHLA